MTQINVAIFGSTGSIGCSTLSVIRENPKKYRVYVLTGGKNTTKMLQQCLEFFPKYVAMADESSAQDLRTLLREQSNKLPYKIEILAGEKAIRELAQLPEIDQVMAAIVGSAGLRSTLAAIEKGKRILLANKESLVTCGHLFMQAVKKYNAELLPVDSEHNAIFQSLPPSIQHNLGFASLKENGVSNIILTGSGGPFRDIDFSLLKDVTPEQAIAHPNWSMGKKISIDSATMMNKGLEYIEARWLFNAKKDEIEIIVHPQSIIHSMVRYDDGSVIAELGNPDMKTPIAHSMAYPQRIKSGTPALDFTKLAQLTFKEPDFNRYPCLKLAIDAFQQGQTATTTLNAANEIAVDAFLNRKIGFMEIAKTVSKVLSKLTFPEPKSIDDVFSIDDCARKTTSALIKKTAH